MAKNCSKCEKKIGMFSNSTECSHADCDYVECDACFEANDNLTDCEVCGGTLCKKHIDVTRHECIGEATEEEAEDDDNGSTYSVEIVYGDDSDDSTGNLTKETALELYKLLSTAMMEGKHAIEIDFAKFKDADKEVVGSYPTTYNLTRVNKIYITE